MKERSEGSANYFEMVWIYFRLADFLSFTYMYIYIPSLFHCWRKVVEITDPLGCVTERRAAASEGFRK